MEVAPNPKHEKYSKTEIVASLIKCAALVITFLGVTFILTIHPQVMNCQYPGTRKMTTKAAIAMNPAEEMNSDDTDKVMNVTTQFQD